MVAVRVGKNGTRVTLRACEWGVRGQGGRAVDRLPMLQCVQARAREIVCRHQRQGLHSVTAAAHVTRHTSHVTRHTSHVTRHTSHVTRHTSHITRHTSHLTRHTSHVTRHTSHVIRHTFKCYLGMKAKHITRCAGPSQNQPGYASDADASVSIACHCLRGGASQRLQANRIASRLRCGVQVSAKTVDA